MDCLIATNDHSPSHHTPRVDSLPNPIRLPFVFTVLAALCLACGGDQAPTAPAIGYRSVTQNASAITNDSLRAIMAGAGCVAQRTGRAGSVIMAAVGGGKAFFDCSHAERPAMLDAIRRYVLNLGAADGGSSLTASGYYIWEADNVTDVCGGDPYLALTIVWSGGEPHEQEVNFQDGSKIFLMVPAGPYRFEVWVDPSYPCGKVAVVSGGTWMPLAPGELPPEGQQDPGDGSPPPPPDEAVRISYLTISPEEAEVDVGSVTSTFTLTAHYSNSTTGVVSTNHWTAAQISVAAKDDNGTFVGLQAGATAVWARIGTDSVSATVEVLPCEKWMPRCKVKLENFERAMLDTVYQLYRRPLTEIVDTMERRICAEAAARVAQALSEHPNVIFRGGWNNPLDATGRPNHLAQSNGDGSFHIEPFLLDSAMQAPPSPRIRALLLRTMMHEMIHVHGGSNWNHPDPSIPGWDTLPFPFGIIASRDSTRSCVKP